jgi:DNA-binding response OmpR family regulator
MSLILLADDSPHALRMGEQILRGEGYEVVSAADGVTAASLLMESDPDILIADLFLPGKSGLELCRELKRGGRLTRVILTAGTRENVDEVEAVQAGSAAVVRKPFEASAFLALVSPMVEQVRNERRKPGSASPEQIHALVQQAIQAELPRVVQEVTARVLAQLKSD